MVVASWQISFTNLFNYYTVMDEEWPILEPPEELPNRWSNQKGCKSYVLFISLLTDLPWEIAASFSRNVNVAKLKFISCLQWFYVILLVWMVIVSMITQIIVTFRRDRLDKDSSVGGPFVKVQFIIPLGGGSGDTQDDKPSNTKSASHDDSTPAGIKLFGDVIILNLITIILIVWVLYRKVRLLCKRTEQNFPTDTENLLNAEILFEDSLSQLVKAVKCMLRGKSTCIFIAIIPVIYIILSISVSALYLFIYFEHTQVMWPKGWEITGSLQITVITIILVGTTAIDLLYIQIVLRYILHCQLNIYYLQLIKGKVESRTYRNQDKAIEDAEKSQKFLKQLNSSSWITGFAVASGLIHAINCAINLSNYMKSDEKSNLLLEEVALACRLFLWIFLTLVPFIQAVRANEASMALSDTGLVMIKPPILFKENTKSQNKMIKRNIDKITLDVKIFNVTIKPGYVCLTVIGLFLLFSLGSGYHLVEKLF